MSTYMFLAIAYCNVFEGFLLRDNLDVKSEHVQLWYPILWKHNAPFIFFLIQDKFLKEFRYMLIEEVPVRITQEAKDFLKGIFVCMKETILTSGCMDIMEAHFFSLHLFMIGILLPKFAANTKHGPPFLIKKRKRQFIFLPFNVANMKIRSSSHLVEVYEMLNAFYLKEAKPLKGFDLEGLFFEHLASMRYSNIFTGVAE
jgi:hypothetical protein